MENLLTINSSTTAAAACDDTLDIDTFFREQLAPLLQKFKYRLSQFEHSVNNDSKRLLQEYSRTKLKRAYEVLERLEQEWHHRWKACSFADKNNMLQQQAMLRSYMAQTLEQSLADLSEKYRELEITLVGSADDYYFETTLDDTIDAMMSKIEEVDSRVSDTIERAMEVGSKVHEKIHKVAGRASEQMDHLKDAMTKGAMELLLYEELPVPWRNNQHILTGYRFLSTPAQCWHSLSYLHNETGNIYTHLIGFVVFLCIGIYELFYSPLLSEAPLIDRVIFAVFFCAACKCLVCSTVWHTLSGINDYAIFKRVACLDYVGISVLICASVVLTEYYGFYCHDMWRNTYMLGTGTLAVIGTIIPFMDWFEKREMKWLRITFFITLAASAAFPVGHLYATYGPEPMNAWLSPVMKSIACYLLGVVVYGNQWPEAFWPGKFDNLGHSHQLWHLFVCGGIWYHYLAAVSFVGQREVFGFCSAA
ncbi:hemolysin-III related-domain-containing protein [Zychaea mexicana]|uniref:hemolysin-III related-domain-containing protein n=1 Tax=Zychaea mexicana TaxID=64656 RepID=UPI0022FE36E8|nr:hemolysin-III related-domain-containing protein [Zychaea mexicana]KAI9490928.1 hemolysin-III related-domain-containing protein [Zychaea mexicana]